VKIEKPSTSLPLPMTTTEGRKAQAPEVPQTAPPTREEEVSLSFAAKKMAALDKEEMGALSFDSAKVSAIEAAIREGNYRINPEKIADGLISSAREFLSSKAER